MKDEASQNFQSSHLNYRRKSKILRLSDLGVQQAVNYMVCTSQERTKHLIKVADAEEEVAVEEIEAVEEGVEVVDEKHPIATEKAHLSIIPQ